MADLPQLAPLPPLPAAGLLGAGVRLRAWDPATDAEVFLRLVRDPAQDRWGMPVFVPRPVDLDAVRARLTADRAAAIEGRPATYAVLWTDSDEVVGEISCRLDLPRMGVADVGYGTLPEARGRGVATTALTLLSSWLLDPVDGAGLARVQLDHATPNIASCRVASGAGFAREGVRRGYLPLMGDADDHWDRYDVCLHGRLPSDGTDAVPPL